MRLFLLLLPLTTLAAPRELTLSSPTNLRFNQNQILEVASPVPTGARVSVDTAATPAFLSYRDSSGNIKTSTNGFYPSVRLISVPSIEQPNFPPEKINQLNSKGLYLSSVDVNSATENSAVIQPLPSSPKPNAGYLKHFTGDGRRLSKTFQNKMRQRFGTQLNRAIPLSGMTPAERTKWLSIYVELLKAGDRTVPVERPLLFISTGDANKNKQLAKQYSEEFEKTGLVQGEGGWTISVLGTAVRHGFPNAPCAEFMSELIRQAYARAGYKIADDFKGKSYLVWHNTAAVVNLAQALFESGWIPWDPVDFKPMTGAIAMHAYATTPGHTYMIAGHNGRFIVDNGSPNGRDLYNSVNGSKDWIAFMYDIGVFFLPPGVIPDPW